MRYFKFFLIKVLLLTIISCNCKQQSDKNNTCPYNKSKPCDSALCKHMSADSCKRFCKMKCDNSSGCRHKHSVNSIKSNNTEITGINNDEKVEYPVVWVYYFHVTNRCPSCLAIENVTKKTIETYFADAYKNGKIKFSILNVDEAANKTIAEKYQAFGSGLFITQKTKNNQEHTTDLTSEGFKYAKNKEPLFTDILKKTISQYLQ